MNRPLRGAIVGCGYFGQIQLEAWSRMESAEIVAACDLDIERAKAAAPAGYSSAEEMLDQEELDFFDIATRPDTHLPMVRLACDRKIPMICQKPVAPDWKTAVALVEAAETAGVRLMIHENWRWQPWYREAKKIIDRGDIGQPVSYRLEMKKADGLLATPYPNQPYFAEMPRLLIYESLVHPIDTARFLFGDISAVVAQARRHNPKIAGEDQAMIILSHESGLFGMVDGNRCTDPVPQGPAMGNAQIEGAGGTLFIRATGDIFVGEKLVWEAPAEIGYKGDCARRTQEHFVDCLLSGEPFESEGREYLKTFGAVEAAYDSVARGAVVSTEKWR